MRFLWAETKQVTSATQEGILGGMLTDPWLVSLLRRELACVSRAGATTETETLHLVISVQHLSRVARFST